MPTSAASSSPSALPLTRRTVGILLSPRATLARVVQRPCWGGILLLSFLLSAAAGAALLSTESGQIALVDRWVRSAEAFGRDIDDAQYARLEAWSRSGALYGVATAAGTSALVLLVGSLLRAAFGAAATFKQVLAVVAHAGIILAVRDVVAAPWNYTRETLGSPLSMSRFFPMLDDASLGTRFLGALDLFVLWWLTIIAIGISILYGVNARSVTGRLFAAYAALALLLAGAMAAAGGTA